MKFNTKCMTTTNKIFGTRSVLMVIALLIAFKGNGQSLKDRMVQMNKDYATLNSVHIRMTIKVFETSKDTKPYYEDVAEIKRLDQRYEYSLNNMAMLMSEDRFIMVDKGSHEIVWSKRSIKDESKMFSDPFKVNLDSLLTLYSTPVLKGRQGNVEHYSLEQKSGPVETVELFIDVVQNVLTRMEYGYRDGHCVIIGFNIFNKSPDFTPDTFDERRYVLFTKDKPVPAPAYRGYNIAMADTK